MTDLLRRRGLLAALLAVLIQLVAVSAVPAAAPDVGAICHAGTHDSRDPAPVHAPDCALCPLCVALAAPAPLPVAGPAVPPRRVVAVSTVEATSRAAPPPAAPRTARSARGPPAGA